MYHPTGILLKQALVAVLALAPFLTAQTTMAAARLTTGGEQTTRSFKNSDKAGLWPVIPRHRVKGKPDGVVIYQFDRSPLGERKPLLFVHGLRGEYQPYFRWKRVIKRFQDYPDFSRQYKIFLARYDSTVSLKKTVSQFQKEIRELHDQCNETPVTVMALSLGGNLVQHSILRPGINNCIRVVFSFGTPFHGSPLFSSDWYQYSLYKNAYYPWTRIDHALTYRLYFQLNPNLLSDLSWDDCDGFMPEAGSFNSRLPWGPRGNLLLNQDRNLRLRATNKQLAPFKHKFITYAGYMVNPYLRGVFTRRLENSILYPYTLLFMKIPAHLAREGPVLQMLNRDITRVIPNDSAKNLACYPHIYGLNDGITPVASAIYLPDEVSRLNPPGSEANLTAIRNRYDVRLARVFRNINHLAFIEGYKPPIGPHLLQDELHPEEGLRTVFDWMLSDLIRFDWEESRIAQQSIRDGMKLGKPAKLSGSSRW